MLNPLQINRTVKESRCKSLVPRVFLIIVNVWGPTSYRMGLACLWFYIFPKLIPFPEDKCHLCRYCWYQLLICGFCVKTLSSHIFSLAGFVKLKTGTVPCEPTPPAEMPCHKHPVLREAGAARLQFWKFPLFFQDMPSIGKCHGWPIYYLLVKLNFLVSTKEMEMLKFSIQIPKE